MATKAEMFEQVKKVYEGLSTSRKISLAAFSILSVGALIFWLSASGRAGLAPLMTNLTPGDAAEIAQRLEQLQIPHTIGPGGTTILVDEAKAPTIRLQLASEGLPRGSGVGFELFNEPPMGMSRFTEQLNYRRALEGELTRTIRHLDGVTEARVHIAVPKKKLFENEVDRPKASVTLTLYRGRRLAQEQVDSIVHLVASAVEGLSADDVTVVDSAGRLLSTPERTDENKAMAMLSFQRTIERSMESRVQEVLERAVGEGHVAVQASVDIDHRKTERTEEIYDPESSAVRSAKTSFEDSRREDDKARGIPGPQLDLTGKVTNQAGDAQTRRQEVKSFELNRTVSREVSETPRVSRVSVAVLIDFARGADGKPKPRSAEEMDALTELVKKSVGFDLARGDQVSVESMLMGPGPAELAEQTGPTSTQTVWYVSGGLLAALIFVSVALLARRRKVEPEETQVISATPKPLRELEASLFDAQIGAPEPMLTVVDKETRLAESEIDAFMNRVKDDPERAAAVLKDWLAEDGDRAHSAN